jgi:YbgC/YbaW family acyl-CoA thioester hydrolase
MLKRSDFRHFEPLRVRWAEVDMQKIVFNGHYLMYFDTAVAGYWRALAMPYHETMEPLHGDLFVRKATVEYESSARYDERIDVGIRCGKLGNSSARFDAAVFRGEQRLVHGELVYVFADPVSQTSRPMPQPLRQVFTDFEAGLPMVELRSGSWAELGAGIRPVRQLVFVEELGLDASFAEGADDLSAMHVAAANRFGLTVACGRVMDLGQGRFQLGRLATRGALRSTGIGRQVLQALLDAARSAGARAVMLQAQSGAAAFYRRAGFEVSGQPFEAGGLPHVEMQLTLR